MLNEELHSFTSRVMKARRMRWTGYVHAYRVLIEKPLEEPRHMSQVCVKIGVKEAV